MFYNPEVTSLITYQTEDLAVVDKDNLPPRPRLFAKRLLCTQAMEDKKTGEVGNTTEGAHVYACLSRADQSLMAVDMLRRWTRSTDSGGLSHGGSASSTTNLTFGGTKAGWMGLKSTPTTSVPGYSSLTPKRQDQPGRSFMFLTGSEAGHGST